MQQQTGYNTVQNLWKYTPLWNVYNLGKPTSYVSKWQSM